MNIKMIGFTNELKNQHTIENSNAGGVTIMREREREYPFNYSHFTSCFQLAATILRKSNIFHIMIHLRQLIKI